MENKINTKFDAIVVGAGPAGTSCAIILAKKGKKVLLIERGDFAGAKNVFGGVVYQSALQEVLTEDEIKTLPIERVVNNHRYCFLTEDESVSVSYNNFKNVTKNRSFTTLRAKFDKYMVEIAKKYGVCFAYSTKVESLIIENHFVKGVQTQNETVFAKIVVLADGVNSILAENLGIRKPVEPEDVALSVKEVFKFDENIINERFNLEDSNSGSGFLFAGYPMDETLGVGFLYTNKATVSIGVGVCLDELLKTDMRPYDYLEKLKKHPFIEPLLKDGTFVEYSAHLIPEGGFRKIPKLYSNGVLVVGDAAGLINNVHFEGTNIAMISGKLAAVVANEAIEKQDVSEKFLKNYHKQLEKSFVFKDMKSYQDVISIVKSRKRSFLNFYIKEICEFFDCFVCAKAIEKKKVFTNFIYNFFSKRCLIEPLKDFVAILKIILGVFR